MDISINYLIAAFDKYNTLIFNSKLKQPNFKLSKAKTYFGLFTCKRMFYNKNITFDNTIKISTLYNRSKDEIDDTLIHEMIHYYIATQKLCDTSPHGKIFIKIMKHINKEYHRNIKVSSKTMNNCQITDSKENNYLILALELKNEKYYLSSVNIKNKINLEQDLRKEKKLIKAYHWYITNDTYFMQWPKVRTLRAKRVDKKLYDLKISEMHVLVG